MLLWKARDKVGAGYVYGGYCFVVMINGHACEYRWVRDLSFWNRDNTAMHNLQITHTYIYIYIYIFYIQNRLIISDSNYNYAVKCVYMIRIYVYCCRYVLFLLSEQNL